MPIMPWDQSLDVGVPSMNREHQEILDVMNKIYDAKSQGHEGEFINSLVSKLGGVCVRHFQDEEKLMERIGYPEVGRHKQLHAKLLGQFTQHAEAIRAANGRPADEFFHFLKFWLTSHIKGIDVKYGAHAASNHAA
jgi:hemerythrin-like metal-binding protein